MPNYGIFKTFEVEGELAPYRIVAPASRDHAVKQASTTGEALLGTTDELGKQTNGRADVCLGCLPEVECGGTIAFGAPLTADVDGRAVPATATGQRIIGYAMTSGAAGDIIDYLFAPGMLALPAPSNP